MAFLFSCNQKAEVIPAPTTSFTFQEDNEGNVSFFENSSNGDTYYWSFGDGFTSYTQSPIHTYNKNGIYSVTLTVTGKGGTTKKTVDIAVRNVVGSLVVFLEKSYYFETNLYLGDVNTSIDDIYGNPNKYYVGYIGGGNYSTSAIQCGDKKGFTKEKLKQGKYYFVALNPKAPRWDGYIEITGRSCHQIMLKE